MDIFDFDDSAILSDKFSALDEPVSFFEDEFFWVVSRDDVIILVEGIDEGFFEGESLRVDAIAVDDESCKVISVFEPDTFG